MTPLPPESALDLETLELLPYGVIVLDARGAVLFYNKREEEISGLARRQVLGRDFFREVAPCAQVRDFQGRFRELMEAGRGRVDFDFTFPFVLGPRRVRITLQAFQKDAEACCIVFVADITGREALRDQLLQAQRFSELGEVTAEVAHNFNNILQTIRLSVELASASAGPQARARLDRALAAAEDGSALVKRCLDIARKEPRSPLEPVDLNAVAEATAEFAEPFLRTARAEGREVTLRLNLAPGPLTVLGDAVELREAVLNLLRNAIEAIPGRGTVRLLTEGSGEAHRLHVLDDGPGMGPEVLEKVFTPLFTTKGERGTGLGLASVHAIARRHAGAVEMTSSPGKGTHVLLTFPQAAPDGGVRP